VGYRVKIVLKKEISGASSRAKRDGVSKGELCDAPLWSPLARVSRAGEILSGNNLGRLPPPRKSSWPKIDL